MGVQSACRALKIIFSTIFGFWMSILTSPRSLPFSLPFFWTQFFKNIHTNLFVGEIGLCVGGFFILVQQLACLYSENSYFHQIEASEIHLKFQEMAISWNLKQTIIQRDPRGLWSWFFIPVNPQASYFYIVSIGEKGSECELLFGMTPVDHGFFVFCAL